MANKLFYILYNPFSTNYNKKTTIIYFDLEDAPDCGLKTRALPETVSSLQNMVEAARQIRN